MRRRRRISCYFLARAGVIVRVCGFGCSGAALEGIKQDTLQAALDDGWVCMERGSGGQDESIAVGVGMGKKFEMW